MECKVIFRVLDYLFDIGINRNIVECKGMYCSPAISYRCVLIETLWNVKLFQVVLLSPDMSY